jgi:lipid II:glycine glycyltransferase (peptidoglycan interpeptide bridge formation enzyme)
VHGGKAIAGAVFFHFGKEAIYKYGASDMTWSQLRPNNLLMWEAIKHYAGDGFTNFSFGITEPENEGLLQFKRSWGAREGMIKYYKYDLRKEAFVTDEFRKKTSYAFFKHMPLPLLKLTGSLIYRHFG